MSKVIINWEGNMKFVGKDDANREITMDASPIYGGMGEGIRPMDLLLMSLGGCTGIEVCHILHKMRLHYDSVAIEVEGERAEDHPKIFKNMRIMYRFAGPNLPAEKVYQAIKLAAETYCSVANMLNKAGSITYSFEVNGKTYSYPYRP